MHKSNNYKLYYHTLSQIVCDLSIMQQIKPAKDAACLEWDVEDDGLIYSTMHVCRLSNFPVIENSCTHRVWLFCPVHRGVLP